MTSEHEHTYYGLAFPFVVCTSQDGPWDDQAFVQGVNLGVLIQRMEYGEDDAIAYVNPDLVRQIDLAAMHFGYTMGTDSWDEHNTLVTLVRGRDDDD